MVEEKKYLPVGRIIGLLCMNFLFPGIMYFIGYKIIYEFISTLITTVFESSEIISLIIQIIIGLILQWIFMSLAWSNSIKKTRQKTEIDANDIPNIMNGLTLFTMLICLVLGVINFISCEVKLNEEIKNSYTIQLYENYIERFEDYMDVSEYKKEKDKMIMEIKKEVYSYLLFLEVGVTVVYFSVLPSVKKELQNSIN